MITALLAVACLSDPTLTPTPTVRWNHDRVNTAAYRVYAQRSGDTSWPWHIDVPVWDGDSQSVPVAPGVDLDIPVQRVVPTAVQLEVVRVMVKAVSPGNVESAPSNIVDICMPPICTKPGPCQ